MNSDLLTASQPLACEPNDPVDFDRSGFFLGDRARPVRNGDTLSILFTFRDTISAKYPKQDINMRQQLHVQDKDLHKFNSESPDSVMVG